MRSAIASADSPGLILIDPLRQSRKNSEHGGLADGIVQSMLLHARSGSGERERSP
jgi:hypothetical protein